MASRRTFIGLSNTKKHQRGGASGSAGAADKRVAKLLRQNSNSTGTSSARMQLLDLHGVDRQITLCVYQKDDTNERINAYIGHKVSELLPEESS